MSTRREAVRTPGRQRAAGPLLLIALAVLSLRYAGLAPAATAQEAGERVVLQPSEVTVERLLELLAPPGTARMAIGGPHPQPVRAQCNVFRHGTRGIEAKATTPVPAIPVEFAFNSTDITTAAAEALTITGKALAQIPSSCFRIDGFTDNVGSEAYNAHLAQVRAEVVVSFLKDRCGIDPQRLLAHGVGMVKGSSNDTEAGRQANRRVEFVNMGSGDTVP